MKWIIIANTNQCRIYDYNKKLNTLKLIRLIDHPENKLKDHEITSDRPGHYTASGASGSSRGAFSQPTDPAEIKIDSFARELASQLDEARNDHVYDELGVVMPAQMEGLLNNHLNKNVKALIKHNLKKNVMHLSEPELLKYLNEHM